MFLATNVFHFAAYLLFGVGLGAVGIVISQLANDRLKEGAHIVPLYFFAAAAAAKYLS